MDGQTPGKRIHQLRVVRDGGFSVTFGVSAVRNLVRIVDMQPVRPLPRRAREHPRSRSEGSDSATWWPARSSCARQLARPRPPSPQPRAEDAAPQPGRSRPRSSEDEYRVLGRFVERWPTLDPLRRAVARRISSPSDSPPRCPRTTTAAVRSACSSCTSASERARARGVSSRGETGAGRERQATHRRRTRRAGTHFAGLLAAAQKRGLRVARRGGRARVRAEYRALAADLARLRTAAGSHAVDELFQLGRLVAGAHNLLYRDRGMALRSHASAFSSPTSRARSVARRLPIALAAALLFGPRPRGRRRRRAHARRWPAEMLPRRHAADAPRTACGARASGEGYIDDPQLFRPVMASSIVANNVQVSFAAFAGGITGGAAHGCCCSSRTASRSAA